MPSSLRSSHHRRYIERALAEVEADRARARDEIDVEQVLEQMRSPDEDVRVRALRACCPCHVPWEIFERVRKPAQRLRRDPSARVRAVALHLEEDARCIAAMEAQVARMEEHEADVADYAYRSRERRRRRRR